MFFYLLKRVSALLVLSLLFACQEDGFEFEGTTDSFEMYSQKVGDNFAIYLYLPPDYSASKQYPLIVGLDGDASFFDVAEIISKQIQQNIIPSAIYIGVGYGSISKEEIFRNRDYTPSITSDPDDYETGGAASFYAFLKDELIPKMDVDYNLSSGKTLLGHSFGGLFSFFAMFQDSVDNPFDKFIPVGASFWYDSGVIFEEEIKYAGKHQDLAITVFAAMGSLEGAIMLTSFEEMANRLKNRNYNNLIFQNKVLKKYGHSRSDFISYEQGLKYVFNQ